MKLVDILCLLTIVLNSNVSCLDECVTYDFDEHFDTLFSSDKLICASIQSPNKWIRNTYTSSDISPPFEQSTAFISPQVFNPIRDVLSCVISFNFNITSGAVIEVLVFTQNFQITDLLIIMSQLSDQAVAGTVQHSPMSPDFVSGWTTLNINIVLPPGVHESNIVFISTASANSTILVDSFRYIPPLYDEQDCTVYDPIVPSTTLPTSPTTEVQETNTSFSTVPPVTESTTIIDSDTTRTTDDYNLTSSVTDPWTTKTTEEGVDITPDPESETNTEDNDITEATTIITGVSSEKTSPVTEPWTTAATDEQTITSTEPNDGAVTESLVTSTTEPTSPGDGSNFWIKLKLKLKMFMDVSVGVN